jgi:hypothetical protein
LTDHQLAKALVDNRDLSSKEREHLEGCPHCQGTLDKLKKDLASLGRVGTELTPDFVGRLHIGKTEPSPFYSWPPWVKPAVAFSVSCMLLLILAWGSGMFWSTSVERGVLGMDPAAQERLFEEVLSLVQEPLPQVYQEIGGGPVFDEENGFMIFLQDVVPNTDEESITQSFHVKGEWAC